MGVQIYILDRRRVTLFIEEAAQQIGTLRRFWKVSEIDNDRAAELRAVEANFGGKPAPIAVMVAEVFELPLASAPTVEIPVHLVLGWDQDRTSVTDLYWDSLPILGYARKRSDADGYTLHEEKKGLLHPMSQRRAADLAILDATGQMVRPESNARSGAPEHPRECPL